jgi:glutathione S-transferase
MKLYTSIGPNSHVVRMFVAEKGIVMEMVKVDIKGAENRREPYLSINPTGTCPTLALDDGRHLSEITAICEYLDQKRPAPPLIGHTPEERAETNMWVRRMDLNIFEPMANGFRFAEGLKMYESRVHVIPQAAADLKQIAQEQLAKLDKQIAGRKYICGGRMTLADITLFVFLSFGVDVGQPVNPELKNVSALYARMKARPSAAA